MNLRPLGLALALAIFPCAGALAQSTIEAPAGSGQRFQGTIAINPATGQPAVTQGYTGATATAPGTSGSSATPVQGVTGGVPVAVTWTGQTVSSNITQFGGSNVVTGTGASGAGIPRVTVSSDSFPSIQPVSGTVTAQQPANTTYAVSWTGQTIAATQSGPWNTNLYVGGAANASGNPAFVQVTNLPATQPVSGTVTANQGAPAAVANAWPTTIVQGGAALSTTNPLFEQTVGPSMQAPGTAPTIVRGIQGASGGIPVGTTDTNIATTVTAPGTAASKAQAVQGVTGGVPMPVTAALNGGTATVYLAQAASINAYNYMAEIGAATAGVGITPAIAQSATSLVGKASQGNLYSAYAVNTTTTAGYLVLINATAAPASGAAITPVDVAALAGAAGATATLNYGAGPPNAYSTGIVALITTSLTTYTPGGAAFIQTRVR